jgi:hypothetical protein
MMKTSQIAAQPDCPPSARSVFPIASRIKAALILLPLAAISSVAQAIPAATASPISTGFALPSSAGTLQYAVSASQGLSSNYFGNAGVDSSTNLSADLAFITSSQLYPFNTVFTGGRSWSSSGQPSYDYLNLAITQGVNVQRWVSVLSDSVSYLPQTASTGLSGVPGVGDLGLNPVQVGAVTGQGVLSGYSTRVANTAALSVERQLTGKTSLQASGSYALTRFLSSSSNPSSPGLDSDGETGSLGLSHRIDARNTLGGNYAYSRNTYSGTNFGIPEPAFSGHTASLQVSHQFTRKLGVSLAAGPQWTSIDTPGSTPALSLFANLSASYNGEFSRATLAYTRSSNSGSGVVGGAISDSITFSTGRTLDRVWLCALTAAYTQTAGLPSAASIPFSFHTTVAGVQISRALVRTLSAYASYTLENQSNQGTAAAVDLFSGLSNVAGFGLTYSPAPIHLGHS